MMAVVMHRCPYGDRAVAEAGGSEGVTEVGENAIVGPCESLPCCATQNHNNSVGPGSDSDLEKIRHDHEVAELPVLILNMIFEHRFTLEAKPGKEADGGMLVDRHLHDDFE